MLMEYEDKIRDLQHTLQRLEDRLNSHDALGDVSHDPILLERLQVCICFFISKFLLLTKIYYISE